MCFIEDAEPFLVDSVKWHKARKRHGCSECGRMIEIGERYMSGFGVSGTPKDKIVSITCTCAHCEIVTVWLTNECGGYVWEAAREDLYEHIDGIDNHGHWCLRWEAARLYVGMKRQWRSFSPTGSLMPIPQLRTDAALQIKTDG